MDDDRDLEFERDMVERLLCATQGVIDAVSADFAAGLVHDLEGRLGRDLAEHGVLAMSEEWMGDTVARIRAGETVRLPTVDELP